MSAPRRPRRIFSYEEALALFPTVRDLTERAVRKAESLSRQVADEEEDSPDERQRREATLQLLVEEWAHEIEALGCEVKGLWLVDWDSGDGYFCWRHPEPTVAHFHGYDEGFAGRVPIN